VKKYYFVGIGGSGMNPLAQILRQRGAWVGGSDRSFDRGTNAALFEKLQRQGIHLFPQDGSGITSDIDAVVISTAIESQNVELNQAQLRSIPVIHRADLLADIFNNAYGIGIGGTSGKTTVTGMVASVLDAAGKDPTVINGGIIKQYESSAHIGNAKGGTSDIVLIETDESDGSIVKFRPRIGVITNISKDHKELDELRQLFKTFAQNTTDTVIINGDDPEIRTLDISNAVTFGMDAANRITFDKVQQDANGTAFEVQRNPFYLSVPGLHNVYNAAAAIAVGMVMGLPMKAIQEGIRSFAGTRRRLDIVSRENGITVVDDFAHNPDKITSSIAALKSMGERLIIIFQPHGYGPTRFLLNELAASFSASLSKSDFLFLLPIYDAGGTADRSITSADLAQKIHGPQVNCVKERKEVIGQVAALAKPGDVIAVMGARDDTLSAFAKAIAETIGLSSRTKKIG
jgi:UDP-N-acetylmuramate--alanine ligase